MRYRLQRHDGTDCSATMVPITVLRMVPIQRYRQRFCIVYFLIDFFIICFYAICHMYQYIRLDFLKRRPDIQIYNEEKISETFKRECGFNLSIVKGIIIFFICLIISLVIWNFFYNMNL